MDTAQGQTNNKNAKKTQKTYLSPPTVSLYSVSLLLFLNLHILYSQLMSKAANFRFANKKKLICFTKYIVNSATKKISTILLKSIQLHKSELPEIQSFTFSLLKAMAAV